MKFILGAIIMVIVLLFLVAIVPDSLNKLFSMFKGISEKYSPPELNFDSGFYFTAEGISIKDVGGCKEVETPVKGMECGFNKLSEPVFSVKVKNSGSKMRSLRAEVTIYKCKDDGEKCEDKIGQIYGETCDVIPSTPGAEFSECVVKVPLRYEAGDYYRIYGGVECLPDSPNGCYNPGQSTPAKSYNTDSWVTIRSVAVI